MLVYSLESPHRGDSNEYTEQIIFVAILPPLIASITKTCLFKYTENFTTKNENFKTKHSDIFHISAQNIDCGYSLEPPRSMFLSRNKKTSVYPCKPQVYFIKVGFIGAEIIQACFRDDKLLNEWQTEQTLIGCLIWV